MRLSAKPLPARCAPACLAAVLLVYCLLHSSVGLDVELQQERQWLAAVAGLEQQ